MSNRLAKAGASFGRLWTRVWRELGVHRGVQAFKKKRLQDLDRKRQARKERKPDPTVAVACPQCGRICASSFGLRSHRRIH